MYKKRRIIFKVSLFIWIFYTSSLCLVISPEAISFAKDYGVRCNNMESMESDELENVTDVLDESYVQETPIISPTISESLNDLEGEKSEEQIKPEETAIVEEVLPKSIIDEKLPGVVYLHIDADSPEAPIMLLDEKMSEDDVMVDISNAMDSNLAYNAPFDLELCLGKIVYREAGNQPFLGKLLVAEGVVSRIASGVYGSDIPAILRQGGYGADMDSNGEYHVYYSDGREVLDFPEENMEAIRIALRGSKVSYVILQEATEVRNQQYGLTLGAECYRYGSIYHYAPALVSQEILDSRTINRVPVSIRYVDHVFYGYWLNKAYAMNIV